MQNAQTIYQQTIFPLPDSEKLRLATIILQDLSIADKSKQSALDLLETIQNNRVFSSSTEVDKHLEAERESWDN
jgi:hypothetical protein